jgi:hypothetical protein
VHQHRIDFDLGHVVAQARGEMRELRDQLRERRDVGFRRSTKSLQQRRGLQFIQHRQSLLAADRRRPIDDVAKQFRGDTAQAHHDHWPEGRVLQAPDDDLDALLGHRA